MFTAKNFFFNGISLLECETALKQTDPRPDWLIYKGSQTCFGNAQNQIDTPQENSGCFTINKSKLFRIFKAINIRN